MAIANGLGYDDVRHQTVTASYMKALKSLLSDFDTRKKTVVIVKRPAILETPPRE